MAKGESLPPQENALTPPLKSWDLCAIAASRLRGGQSGVIGLIVRDLSAPFYAELTAGLTEALEAQGRMVLLHGGKDGEQLAQRFSLLPNQGVDGVVIAGAAGSSDDLRRMAEEKLSR